MSFKLYLSGIDETVAGVEHPRLAALQAIKSIYSHFDIKADARAVVDAAYRNNRQEFIWEFESKEDAKKALLMLQEQSRGVCAGYINPPRASNPLLIILRGGKLEEKDVRAIQESQETQAAPTPKADPAKLAFYLLALTNGNPIAAIRSAAFFVEQGIEEFTDSIKILIAAFEIKVQSDDEGPASA